MEYAAHSTNDSSSEYNMATSQINQQHCQTPGSSSQPRISNLVNPYMSPGDLGPPFWSGQEESESLQNSRQLPLPAQPMSGWYADPYQHLSSNSSSPMHNIPPLQDVSCPPDARETPAPIQFSSMASSSTPPMQQMLNAHRLEQAQRGPRMQDLQMAQMHVIQQMRLQGLSYDPHVDAPTTGPSQSESLASHSNFYPSQPSYQLSNTMAMPGSSLTPAPDSSRASASASTSASLDSLVLPMYPSQQPFQEFSSTPAPAVAPSPVSNSTLDMDYIQRHTFPELTPARRRALSMQYRQQTSLSSASGRATHFPTPPSAPPFSPTTSRANEANGGNSGRSTGNAAESTRSRPSSHRPYSAEASSRRMALLGGSRQRRMRAMAPVDDSDDEDREYTANYSPYRSRSSFLTMAPQDIRQFQLLRGAMRSKIVASRATIKSLRAIDVETLPEGERTCNICYNDYNQASPEGISEPPVKVPICGHVFGITCIKKWFEDSDTCPYCRVKVPSESKMTLLDGSSPASLARRYGISSTASQSSNPARLARLQSSMFLQGPRNDSPSPDSDGSANSWNNLTHGAYTPGGAENFHDQGSRAPLRTQDGVLFSLLPQPNMEFMTLTRHTTRHGHSSHVAREAGDQVPALQPLSPTAQASVEDFDDMEL